MIAAIVMLVMLALAGTIYLVMESCADYWRTKAWSYLQDNERLKRSYADERLAHSTTCYELAQANVTISTWHQRAAKIKQVLEPTE